MNVRGKTLVLYLALNPADYLDSKYHFTDVSEKARFSKVPMMLKVRSDRGVKYALELIDDMMQKYEIPEAYDMTTEAVVAKVMWTLPRSKSATEFRDIFLTPIGNDRI